MEEKRGEYNVLLGKIREKEAAWKTRAKKEKC